MPVKMDSVRLYLLSNCMSRVPVMDEWCQSALAEPRLSQACLCCAVWTHRRGSRGGRAADLCRSGLGYSGCPWGTSCAQYLASVNSGSQRSPPCHQNNPEYYHQHQITYSQEIFLSSWVTGLAVAGLPHLEGPKWKTAYLIISPVCFSAEKDHSMWLGDALNRLSSRYLFLYFTFFPLDSYLFALIYLRKKL